MANTVKSALVHGLENPTQLGRVEAFSSHLTGGVLEYLIGKDGYSRCQPIDNIARSGIGPDAFSTFFPAKGGYQGEEVFVGLGAIPVQKSNQGSLEVVVITGFKRAERVAGSDSGAIHIQNGKDNLVVVLENGLILGAVSEEGSTVVSSWGPEGLADHPYNTDVMGIYGQLCATAGRRITSPHSITLTQRLVLATETLRSVESVGLFGYEPSYLDNIVDLLSIDPRSRKVSTVNERKTKEIELYLQETLRYTLSNGSVLSDQVFRDRNGTARVCQHRISGTYEDIEYSTGIVPTVIQDKVTGKNLRSRFLIDTSDALVEGGPGSTNYFTGISIQIMCLENGAIVASYRDSEKDMTEYFSWAPTSTTGLAEFSYDESTSSMKERVEGRLRERGMTITDNKVTALVTAVELGKKAYQRHTLFG